MRNPDIPTMEVIVDGDAARRPIDYFAASLSHIGRLPAIPVSPQPVLRDGEVAIQLISGETHIYHARDTRRP